MKIKRKYKIFGKIWMVKLVTEKQIADVFYGKSTRPRHRFSGLMDSGTRTIYIDKKLSPRKRMATLHHEIKHVIFDKLKIRLTEKTLDKLGDVEFYIFNENKMKFY